MCHREVTGRCRLGRGLIAVSGLCILRSLVGLGAVFTCGGFFLGKALGFLFGEPLRLLLGETPSLFLRRQATCLFFEASDLLGDQAVGFLDLITDLLPLGEAELHLGAEFFRFGTRPVELFEALLEFGPIGFGLGQEVGRQVLGRFLLGDANAQLIEEFVLVADDLVEERTTKGSFGEIGRVELSEVVATRRDERIDGAVSQPHADRFDLLVERLGLTLGGCDLRLRLLDAGRHRLDARLLQCDVRIDRAQRLDELCVLCAQGIDFSRCFRGIAPARLSFGPQVISAVLGDRAAQPETDEARKHHHPEWETESSKCVHSVWIVTRMQHSSAVGAARRAKWHDAPMPLADYRIESFSHNGFAHDVYHRGEGACVLVAPEIPGITPPVAAFADRLVDAGFSVAIASLFGTPGEPSSTGRALKTVAKACVSKEFHVLATNDSSPATDWLRALARDLHARHGGPGIGFVGMCFTGGFGLAMLLDDAVIAPVLSQPSLPFGLGGRRKASTGLSDAELDQVAASGCPVLGLRFTGDMLVPGDRFATLKAALGDNFSYEEIPSPSDTPGAETAKDAHSVLTEHLAPDDQPDHPTQVALAKTLAFLRDRLVDTSS